MATPHIQAENGAFAKTVLMPGDPLRSKYIAEHYLEKAELVNNVRGIQGYTGYYHDRRVSVMASGMGMPSMGIYSYELYKFFDVQNIIRVGSAGAMTEKLQLRDVVVAMSAYTDSNYGKQFGFDGTLAPCCSFELFRKALNAADKTGSPIHAGAVYSSDVFYNQGNGLGIDALNNLDVLCVDMETYALYLNAAAARRNAITLLTISDHLITGEKLSAMDRQTKFDQMIEMALAMA